MITDLMLGSVMILIVLGIIMNLICLCLFIGLVLYEQEHENDR